MPRVIRNSPTVDVPVHDEPIPRQAPLRPRPVTMLMALDSYGGVTAPLKRAIRWQPLAAAEYRSVGMPIAAHASWRSTTSSGIKGKEGFAVSIQGCKRDKGHDLHRGSLPTYTSDFPYLLGLLAVTDIFRAPPCRSGKSEVDGSDPPFFLPGAGAGVLRNLHLRSTPWGGRSLPKYPLAGRPQMTPLTGKMRCMSTPDIHRQRLEALKKQALERFRARCGEAYEAAPRPPSRDSRNPVPDVGSGSRQESTHASV